MLQDLESAPLGPEGVPECLGEIDAHLLDAAREDLCEFLGRLFTQAGMRPESESHSVRTVSILTAAGWTEVSERYVPKRPSALRAALGVREKATAAVRDAVERCGALVVRRCKQAGMHWRHANAIRISATHAHYRSQRKAA